MKKQIQHALVSLAAIIAIAGAIGLASSELKSADQYSRVENVVYYPNPLTGKLGLYLSFGLEPNHRYKFQATRDGVHFFDLFVEDTTGRINETYESFNIPDPANALWPRIEDLGSTQ